MRWSKICSTFMPAAFLFICHSASAEAALVSTAQSDDIPVMGKKPVQIVASNFPGLADNDKSRIFVIYLDSEFTRGVALKNESGRIELNGQFRSSQVRQIMPDRVVHIFVVFREPFTVSAQVGSQRLRQIGADRIVKEERLQEDGRPELKDGEPIMEVKPVGKRLKIRHYSGYADQLYGSHTYTAVHAPSGGEAVTRTFSATVEEAPLYDSSTEISALAVKRSELPIAFGFRKSILPINRIGGNEFASYLTLDAVVLYKDDEDSALGGALTFNFSLGGQRRENLPGRFGFPVYFCVSLGFTGLNFSRVNSAGRPFIGLGISVPTSIK